MVNVERFEVVLSNVTMRLRSHKAADVGQVSNKTGQASNMTGLNEDFVLQIVQVTSRKIASRRVTTPEN